MNEKAKISAFKKKKGPQIQEIFLAEKKESVNVLDETGFLEELSMIASSKSSKTLKKIAPPKKE